MAGYLLDAGIISAIRNSGLSPQEWVGDEDILVPAIAFSEVQADLEPDDIQSLGNAEVMSRLPAMVYPTRDIVDLATALRQRYAAHHPPLAVNDSLIIATALIHDRVVITKNTHDFHYEDGLRWIDASAFDPTDGPLLSIRQPVDGALKGRQCCGQLRALARTAAQAKP